jgi:hypothetical protein
MEPDYIDRIAGARSWRMANTMFARMGGLLWADAMLEPWPMGSEYAAKCEAGCALVPGEDHICGIYAWYDVGTMAQVWHPPGDFRRARGVVSARGGVVLHERGWRAEFVRVEAIFDDVPDDDLPIPKHAIAEAYDVPVIKPEDYEKFCRERGLVLHPS